MLKASKGKKSQHRRHECMAPMTALDTNILVRFLVENDDAQLAATQDVTARSKL